MFIPLAIIFAAAILLFVVEKKSPNRTLPEVSGWWARTAFLNAFQLGTVFASGYLWENWMYEHQPYRLYLPTLSGALVGYLAITFADYWWHRIRHSNHWLWVVLHQMHHSPQRIEVATSFYRHPLEILVSGVLVSGLLYIVVGLDTASATYALMIAACIQMFYHSNIATPYWLGYIIQRPESHCLHHKEGFHNLNFADLAIWDMLFGTFCNPKKALFACGFGNDEMRFASMIVGHNVSKDQRRETRYAD